MQIASILSDLTSLRVCDHAAAMALVSAQPPNPTPSSPPQSIPSSPPQPTTPPSKPIPSFIPKEAARNGEEEREAWKNTAAAAAASRGGKNEDVIDVDMRRAMDLVQLHYGVKVKHARGEDDGLKEARRDVEAVLERLKKGRGVGKGHGKRGLKGRGD